ncbi:MAG: DUF4248 domain-containing protein [Bacteroidaceae bacterium]|nr:DUF4248 domain-containing protein [Bacteroidaceae bacterium]
MANLGNRVCRIGELAKAYYPDRGYSTALRLFHKDLRLTRGLWNALQRQGYVESDRLFTRSQVKVIVKYLGDP